MRFIILVFIIILQITPCLYSQSINFFKEDMSFILIGDTLHVKGVYYFSNNSPRPAMTFLFFPIKDFLKSTIRESITVFDLKEKKPVKVTVGNKKGILFPLSLEPYDTAIYHIEYSQKLLSDTLHYFLTTTAKWNKPLLRAIYKLITRKNVNIKSFSFSPDTMYAKGNLKIYLWEKRNFMPSKDFVVVLQK